MNDVVVIGARLHGYDLDPTDVTSRLQINPARQWKRGDVHQTSAGTSVVRKSGLWMLSPLERSASLEDQLSGLLEQLDGHGNLFDTFPALQSAVLTILVSTINDEEYGSDFEFSLSNRLLNIASELGLEISVSFASSPSR